MEEDFKKMAALKRAFADIIFNTAKESAARVLAAERRALVFQQTLFATKEEAVANMLRLKALMEDKIRETEKTVVCQAKKIEELELQLGEAEDTIVDLREELIMIKNVSVQPSSEGSLKDACMACNNIGNETSTDNLNELGNVPILCNDTATLSQKTSGSHQCCLENTEKTEYTKRVSVGDCPGNTDLESFIWSKVPELYRKGYTQRIHALEHNLASKGSFGESNGLQASSKSEPFKCASEKLQSPCKTDSAMLDKRTTQVKDVSMFEETEEQPCYCKTVEAGQEPGCSGKDHLKFSSEFSPRKQRTIYNQSNDFSDGIFSDKLKSCSGSYKFIAHDKCNEAEAPNETPAPFTQVTEIDEPTEEKKSLADLSTERESLMLNRCRLGTSIKIENMRIQQCTERRNSGILQNQNQSVCVDKFLQDNSLRNSEDVKDPLLSRIFSNAGGHPSSVAIQSKEESENIIGNLDNCNTVEPGTKDIANGTAQAGTDKFLKYTFQRKRKKGSSPIKNEIVFPEKKPNLKPKSVEKQNSVPVPSKSSVATDLPRNNRRLVQVARQLISLSEKRW